MTLSQFDRANIDEIMAGEGSWFSAQLLRLIIKADWENRYRLNEGFPDYYRLVVEWEQGHIPAREVFGVSRLDLYKALADLVEEIEAGGSEDDKALKAAKEIITEVEKHHD